MKEDKNPENGPNEQGANKPGYVSSIVSEDLKKSDLLYHYSREQRLESASLSVKELYDSSKVGKSGFFRRAISTKSSKYMLIVLMVLFALAFFLRFLGVVENTNVILAGNRLVIDSIRYEGRLFVFIDKTAQENAYTGAVYVSVNDVARSLVHFSQNIEEKVVAVIETSIVVEEIIFSAGNEILVYKIKK